MTVTASDIVQTRTRDGREFVELPSEHLASAFDFAKVFLEKAGIGSGDIILLVGDGDDTPLLASFARAANSLECCYSTADAVRFTRANLLAFFEQFRFKLILGLNHEVVEVIQRQGVDAKVLFTGAQIYATPEAKAAMTDASGVRTWLPLGPLVAVETDGGDLRVDAGMLSLSNDSDGAISLHTVDGTSLTLDVRGSLSDTPCPFGRATKRVDVEPAHNGSRS